MSKSIIVTIEKIIPGGSGLARMADGHVVMVPRVIPGEKVAVKILQKKKGYAQAELIEILEAAPERIDPPCTYYGDCGGCDLQHINYEEQLQIKEQILVEQLFRNFGDDTSVLKSVLKIQAAKEPFSYRQRLRLHVDARGRIGFYRQRSQEVVPISQCLLAHPKINQVLSEILDNKDALTLVRNCEALELLYDQREEKVVVVFHLSRKPRATDNTCVKNSVDQIPAIKSMYLKTKAWGSFGPFIPSQNTSVEQFDDAGFLHFSVQLKDGKTARMLFEAGGFCQVNAKQNEWLIETLLDWTDISAHTSMLDLYCGLGNFSIPAAMSGKNMLGMDLQRSAIRSAVKNAQNNGLLNCLFNQQSAYDAAQKLAKDNSSFDLVILDPPRQGCKEIIPFVGKLAASQIIYISCDPATLARDLRLLLQVGFVIEKIQALDMFPQTHHIETIIHLRKSLT